MTLHMVTLHSTFLVVRISHRLESFVTNPFRYLNNQLWLLLGPIVVPTNQYKTFLTCFVFTHMFLGNTPKDHPFHNCFKPNTLKYEVLK
ncbi:hypothetical protein GmHk_20G056757 [Glycine max]|nr:hypothetical protein GmHk_20G056757 [Glycine max]